MTSHRTCLAALSSAPASPDEQVADAGAPTDAAPPPDDAAPPEEKAAPGPPPIFLDSPPEARSKPPTSKEWEAEEDFQRARGAIACRTRRVREWVVQIKQQLPGYGYGFAGALSDTERTLFVISETWIDGDPGPVVSVTES
jgi:hypothetical protein